MKRIRIVLPAYNEELSLPSLLSRVEEVREKTKLPIEVLVVNDGSSDRTIEVIKPFPIEILDLQPNRGLAGALREGLQKALTSLNDEDILVIMDADDSHDPALVQEMVVELDKGADVVIASRYRKGSQIIGLSRLRRFLSIGAGVLFIAFIRIKGVRDYTCGYRAYRVSLLKKVMNHYQEKFIEQQGFGCTAEILLKTRRFKPVVKEVPFILHYDQKRGVSKMKVWKTVRQTIMLIIQYSGDK